MNPKRFNPILIAVFAVVVTAIVAFVFWQIRSGIRVTLTNRGSTPLHSVVLHVTGRSYPLGELGVGTSVKATIKPTGESGLKIEFEDGDGKQQQLDAGGYFEPGYWGTLRVSIKDGAIAENDQQVTVGLPSDVESLTVTPSS